MTAAPITWLWDLATLAMFLRTYEATCFGLLSAYEEAPVSSVDHPRHDLDTPAYRALNPFGQVPVIDDGGGWRDESSSRPMSSPSPTS